METVPYRSIEMFVLFVLLPVSLALRIPPTIKIIGLVLGIGYVAVLIYKWQYWKPHKNTQRDTRTFFKNTALRLLLIVPVTIGFVLYEDADALFRVVYQKPVLWVTILFVYAFLSVWPQEVVYRTFFFRRYEDLMQNEKLFILINATLFSLAHIFLRSTLVHLLTFIGGVFFALTYRKYRSTFFVSFEHALYGNWLFTVGMGEMLAFPG